MMLLLDLPTGKAIVTLLFALIIKKECLIIKI